MKKVTDNKNLDKKVTDNKVVVLSMKVTDN